MKRALVILGLVGAGLVTAARPARAQTAVRLGGPSDTMVGAVPGASARIPVSATNPVYYSYPITYARLTFGFDPAKVQSVSAVPSNLGTIVSATPGTGTLTVAATGYANTATPELIGLRVTLQAGAGDGAYVWVRVDSLASYSYALAGSNTLVRSSIGQVCHATQMWGDVDENGRVDSRDALITLSAAVGLPVTGFPGLATLGDVDGDVLVNSRDALMMLSYAVDVATEGASRVGGGIPDVCPSPSAPGETVVFKRTGPGAGLYRLDSTATSPVMLIGSNGLDDFPRMDATDTAVTFQCDSTTTPQLCRSNRTGVGRRYLGPPGSVESNVPDWSPDGAGIAFVQSGYVSTTDSSGTTRAYVGGTPTYGANGTAWSRDGTLLAFSNMSNGIKTIRLSDSVVTLLTSAVNDGDQMRWSPDGADVLFTRIVELFTIWSVSAAGGTPQRLVAFQGGSRGFDVGPQGILFTATGPGGGNAVWLLKGGPTGPIVRITSPPSGGGDLNPSFRRNP